MAEKRFIMLHHSYTPDSPSISWGAIHRYHTQDKGWSDIGYHYGVEQIGDGFYGIVGRPVWKDGAACYQSGMNRSAVHICCIGNFDLAPPPPGMLLVLVKRLILPTMRLFHIGTDAIVGHSQYADYKTCPGKRFDLEQVKLLVRKELQ